MLSYLKYRFRLYKLYNQNRRLQKKYDLYIGSAERNRENTEELIAEAIHIRNEYDIEIRELYTDYLTETARKLVIELPSYEDETLFEKPMGFIKKILTNKGVSNMRSSIRIERRERREGIVQLIALIIGLIGAITGIIAVIKN